MLPNSILHHLLFVDDDEDDFLIFAEALKEINAEVQVTYLSGFDQLKNLNRSDFDLIFLDINMPAVNGIECLKRLKETNLKNLPVVMYSTTRNSAYIEEAYKSGANLFFRKPISFSSLTSALKSLLQLNWNRPQQITNDYTDKGIYRTFETA
ncbi:MAG: response regulator [Chitinophagaceae bacterium]